MFRANSYLALVLILVFLSSCESEPPIALAKKKLESGDTTSAVFYLREVIENDSLNKYANEFLANYYFINGVPSSVNSMYGDYTYLDSAKYFYQILHSSDPSNLFFLKRIALSHFNRRDYEEAIKKFRLLSVKDNKDASHHYNIGICKQIIGDYFGAIAAFTDALKIFPQYQEALYMRAETMDIRLIKDAEDQAEWAARPHTTGFNPRPPVRNIPWDLFIKFYSQGAFEIKNNLNTLLRLNPNHLAGKSLRARVSRHSGDYEASIKEFDELIMINSKNGDYYLSRGLSKYYSGNRQASCQDFSIAVELGASDAKEYLKDFCR